MIIRGTDDLGDSIVFGTASIVTTKLSGEEAVVFKTQTTTGREKLFCTAIISSKVDWKTKQPKQILQRLSLYCNGSRELFIPFFKSLEVRQRVVFLGKEMYYDPHDAHQKPFEIALDFIMPFENILDRLPQIGTSTEGVTEKKKLLPNIEISEENKKYLIEKGEDIYEDVPFD